MELRPKNEKPRESRHGFTWEFVHGEAGLS